MTPRYLLLMVFAFLCLSSSAIADRVEYDECMDRCRRDYGSDACYYNCNVFMDRPGPPPPPASDLLFGAIALDAQTLKSGYAKDALSREDAEARAVAECRKVGGSADGCKVILWRHNSCMALVMSREGSKGPSWGYAYSDDGRVSRRNATKSCQGEGGSNCQVVISFCTG